MAEARRRRRRLVLLGAVGAALAWLALRARARPPRQPPYEEQPPEERPSPPAPPRPRPPRPIPVEPAPTPGTPGSVIAEECRRQGYPERFCSCVARVPSCRTYRFMVDTRTIDGSKCTIYSLVCNGVKFCTTKECQPAAPTPPIGIPEQPAPAPAEPAPAEPAPSEPSPVEEQPSRPAPPKQYSPSDLYNICISRGYHPEFCSAILQSGISCNAFGFRARSRRSADGRTLYIDYTLICDDSVALEYTVAIPAPRIGQPGECVSKGTSQVAGQICETFDCYGALVTICGSAGLECPQPVSRPWQELAWLIANGATIDAKPGSQEYNAANNCRAFAGYLLTGHPYMTRDQLEQVATAWCITEGGLRFLTNRNACAQACCGGRVILVPTGNQEWETAILEWLSGKCDCQP